MEAETAYAGLWARTKAFALDYLILAAYLVLMTGAIFLARRLAPVTLASLFAERATAQLAVFLILTLPVSLYFLVSEASGAQGTWGKRRLGLRVAGPGGSRIGLARAIGRTAVKLLPWEATHTLIWQLRFAPASAATLVTWGFLAVWAAILASALSVRLDPRRRALHDRVAGTVVLRRAPQPAPARELAGAPGSPRPAPAERAR